MWKVMKFLFKSNGNIARLEYPAWLPNCFTENLWVSKRVRARCVSMRWKYSNKVVPYIFLNLVLGDVPLIKAILVGKEKFGSEKPISLSKYFLTAISRKTSFLEVFIFHIPRNHLTFRWYQKRTPLGIFLYFV